MADADDGPVFVGEGDEEMGEGSPGLFILDLLRDGGADAHLVALAEKVGTGGSCSQLRFW
jgi:hypothetical protein